jgi:Putative metal-binding motif/SprB repeat
MKSCLHPLYPVILLTLLLTGAGFSNNYLQAQTPCHPDFDALIALYNSTGGANWTNNSGWADGAAGANCDVCTWYGVNCTDGRVTQLYLDGNHLVGALPNEIGDLTTLRYIGMQTNQLSGIIPASIGNLLDLSGLDLNVNQLSGTIPPSLGNLAALIGLGLYNNQLTGALPPELGNLTNLVSLGLSNNQLSGCIPASYTEFCSGTYVYMGGNPGLPGGGDFDAFCANGTGADADGDAYCAGTGLGADCNDNNPLVHPNAPEICNGLDDDCDGQIDQGAADADGDGICDGSDNCPGTYNPDQADNEGDGIGDVCDPNDDNDPSPDNQDCAPFNPNVYAGATEICGNLIDDNCNGKVDEPIGIQTLVQKNILCNGQATGSIQVTGACGLPPYTYVWSNGATTATIIGLIAGAYKVTVTDAQGLTRTKNHTLTQPTLLSLSMVKNDAGCFGGSNGTATANASGGKSPYTYLWSNGSTTKTITGLTAGAYFVTVSDFNGCSKVGGIAVDQPTEVVINSAVVAPDPARPGKYQITVSASGGTPYTDGYRYRRCNSGGASCSGWQASNVLTNLAANSSYLVRVKDKNACEAQQLVPVSSAALSEGSGETSRALVRQKTEPAGHLWSYPNPAGAEMWVLIPVEAPEGEAGSLELADLSGRLVLQTKTTALPNEPVRLSLTDLADGVYNLFWSREASETR